VHADMVAAQTPTELLAVAGDAAEAARALAEGADLIDARGLDAAALAAIRAAHPGARLWPGPSPGAPVPRIVDADLLAASAVGAGTGTTEVPLAAVAAAAAAGTWLGAALIRTRHVRPARRAIDMALTIAGARLPARTLRGLA
jgi:hypothetical protein